MRPYGALAMQMGVSPLMRTYEFWLAGPDETKVFDECGLPEFGSQLAGEVEPEEPLARQTVWWCQRRTLAPVFI